MPKPAHTPHAQASPDGKSNTKEAAQRARGLPFCCLQSFHCHQTCVLAATTANTFVCFQLDSKETPVQWVHSMFYPWGSLSHCKHFLRHQCHALCVCVLPRACVSRPLIQSSWSPVMGWCYFGPWPSSQPPSESMQVHIAVAHLKNEVFIAQNSHKLFKQAVCGFRSGSDLVQGLFLLRQRSPLQTLV